MSYIVLLNPPILGGATVIAVLFTVYFAIDAVKAVW